MNCLAHKLGTIPHVSPLLMKARRLGFRDVDDLCGLAVSRGCSHYDVNADRLREEMPVYGNAQSASPTLSNEELAIALLSICTPHSQHALRVGAAMLGAAGNSAETIARLAIQERCVITVRHVAACGVQVEPENPFWREVLRLTPEVRPAPVDLLPHVTRFAAMNGLTRQGKRTSLQWIRPNAA